MIFFHDFLSYRCRKDVFYVSLEMLKEIPWLLFLLTCHNYGPFLVNFWSHWNRLSKVILYCFFAISWTTDVGMTYLGVTRNVRGNLTTLISTNLSQLRPIPSQFAKSMNQTDCRKSFFDIFPRYLELLMSKGRVLCVVWNIKENFTTLISTNLSWLRLIPSHLSKLVDRTDFQKSLFIVFPQYIELLMLEWHI